MFDLTQLSVSSVSKLTKDIISMIHFFEKINIHIPKQKHLLVCWHYKLNLCVNDVNTILTMTI